MIFEFSKIVLLMVLVCCLLHTTTSDSLDKDICTRHLHALADKQALFAECSTMHSVPVNLCIGCYEPYNEMQVAYENLRSLPNCTEKYFDKDRINIVATTQSILAGLWSKAYCQDCFTSNNNSYVFGMKVITLEICLTNEDNAETVCLACLPVYTDLNLFYVGLEHNSSGKVCYDIQDSMNRTRMNWSKKLGCCHREFHMTLFLVFGSIVLLLPVVFYSGVIALNKRLERNHTLLIEDSEFNEPSPSRTRVTSRPRTVTDTTAVVNSASAPAATATTTAPAATAITTAPSATNSSSHAAAAVPPVDSKKAKFDVDIDSDSDNEYTNTKALSSKSVDKED